MFHSRWSDVSFIDSWDSGQPGATWDSGLQWDVNVGPASGDVVPYLNLVTSEHRVRPKFMAMVEGVMQPFADIVAVMRSIVVLYDLDVSVGAQEDVDGEWIGASRALNAPLTNVYFSFDVSGLGFDEGTWQGPFNPNTYVINLSDDQYRLLLRAKLLNDRWDGTIPGAYAIWAELFDGTDFGILIQDLGNMHMLFALTGPTPDVITLALFKGGYLNVKPAGVKIDAYLTPSVPSTPYFGFDVENASISGFDSGAWGLTS